MRLPWVNIDRNSWKLQVPAGFGHITADKGNAWITDNRDNAYRNSSDANYNANEQSYVESPCFDINALDRPMVSFNYWSDTDDGSDGVALLYTIDNGTTWFRLGTENQGLFWYNTRPVLGKPGDDFTDDNGDSQGWSGNTQTVDKVKAWKTARFGLDEALNKMNAASLTNKLIRFRMVFGSNADNAPNTKFDGFAFDDFQLSNRNRLVLMEYFINQGIENAATLDHTTHSYAASKAEIINIHYHVGFPGKDEINKLNNKDPGARAFHYGIRRAPQAISDGKTRDELITENYANTWVDTAFSRRTLLTSPFIIDIAQPIAANGTLTVSATVNAIEPLNHKVIMYIAIIDTAVVAGGATYYNVVRKMLPDAAGIFRAQVWATGDAQTLNQTWDYGSLNPAKFKVVVFVSDYDTKEIYQAAVNTMQANRKGKEAKSGDKNLITGIGSELKEGRAQVFPNPTSNQLNIILPEKVALSADARWEIVNPAGKTIKSGRWADGKKQLLVDVNKLATGVYIIKVHNHKLSFSHRFEKY